MVEFDEGAIIMREGSVDLQMYIVVEGVVSLHINYGKPDERVIGVCSSNKLFGEMGLLAGAPSPYTAVAFSKVKLAYFMKNNLKSFIKGYPDYAIKILYNIAKLSQILSENLHLSLQEIQGMKETRPDAKVEIYNVNETEAENIRMLQEDAHRTGKNRIGDDEMVYPGLSRELNHDIAKYLVRGEQKGYHYSFLKS